MTMFLKNRHSDTYFRLVDRARGRELDGYSERHHVLPKCMGGTDDSTNIVRLTAREHYIAHLLLCRMTDGTNQRKMAFAFSRMNGRSQTHERLLPPARWYEYSRKLLSEVQRNRTVSDATRSLIGDIARNRSLDSREKMSAAKRKPCTIDGQTIFPSRQSLGKALGWGKSGALHPSFRYT